MKKTLFIALALLCLFLPAEAKKKVRVHTIGDSTMADYAENTTRTRGWGEMFQEFFTDDVEVINYARGGRSTRSFINEGLWDKVKANIQKGDYVLIQFAHNDEKGAAHTATTAAVPTRGGTTKPISNGMSTRPANWAAFPYWSRPSCVVILPVRVR